MLYTNVCKHCYKVFKFKIRTTSCKECKAKDENHFSEIEQYLRLYPNSNALQISEELGITAYEVVKYIDEGRLITNRGTFSQLPDTEGKE